MTAYVLIDLDVHDLLTMSQYEAEVGPIIAQYGGKLLVKELNPDLYEGDWAPTLIVVLEFSNRAAVRAFYDAPEYQPVKALRSKASSSNGLIVVGD
jgi:uncharacterized protein (DUF1330 family)